LPRKPKKLKQDGLIHDGMYQSRRIFKESYGSKNGCFANDDDDDNNNSNNNNNNNKRDYIILILLLLLVIHFSRIIVLISKFGSMR
jgi:hypothetical protein